MAVSGSNLTLKRWSVSGTSSSTASITPSTNALVLCLVSADASVSLSAPSVSGCGLTWVLVTSVANAGGDDGLYLFRAMGTPSAGAVTVTFGVTVNGGHIIVDQFTGVDTSGTNGSGAITQSATGGPTAAASLTVTLAAFASALNGTYGGFRSNSTSTTATSGTGFTGLNSDAMSGPGNAALSEWRADNDTSVDATLTSSSGTMVGVAVELTAKTSSTVAVGQALETDTASTITPTFPPVTVAVGKALETDTAQPIHGLRGRTLGQAVETDTGRQINARLVPHSTPTPEWTLVVTDRTGTVYASMASTDSAATAPVIEFRGQDPLSDIGVGDVVLPLTHSVNAAFVEDRLLHLYVRGRRVTTMKIGVADLVIVDRSEEAGETQTWNLETLFGLLSEGDVEAPSGVDSQPAAQDRIFDSSDPARDNSDFSACAVLGTVTDAQTNYPVTPYAVGVEYPDTTRVIGPPGYSWGDDAPDGDHFTYADVNFVGGSYRVNGTFDNGGELRVDGKSIQSFTVGFGSAFQSSKIAITAGIHRVWARVQNGGLGAGTNGPCTTAIEFVRVDAGDNALAVEGYTSSSWKWMTAPAAPPGFTIGELVALVLAENQAGGRLANITLSCTDTHDSAGVAWSNTWDVSTKSWSPVSTFFLKELSETYADFGMRYVDGDGVVLDVWHKGGRGQVSSVTLARGVNLGSLHVKGAPTVATSFVVEHNEGELLSYRRVQVTPLSGHPVKEQALSLGAAHSTSEVDRVAADQLAQFGRKRGMLTAEHLTSSSTPDAEMPGLAYWTGDTITVPTDASLTPGAQQVIAVTWELDRSTGELTFTPEFGDLVIPVEARPALSLRKMASPSLGGQARPATP